jgi:KDO2-lipid IV(A) lauroyltransferase
VTAAAPAPADAPATPDARPVVWRHRAEFGALRAALGGLGALPWARAAGVGAALGRAGYRPLGIRRAVVEEQIAAAFPDWPAERVREVADASYASLGRTTVEASLLARLGARGVLGLFAEVQGWEVLEAARAEGRGVVFVTGHLGNWELAGAYVAARGVPLDVVARQQENPLFDRFLTRTRERLGMRVVWDGDAVRRAPRALREGRGVAFLVDQGAAGLASTWAPFFGRPPRRRAGRRCSRSASARRWCSAPPCAAPTGASAWASSASPWPPPATASATSTRSSSRTRPRSSAGCGATPSSTSGSTGGGSTSRAGRVGARA